MANNPHFPGMQPHQPPVAGSMDPPQNFGPPMPVQFRPPGPPPQQFMPMAPPNFQPVGHSVMNAGMPSQPPHGQFPQPMPQLPARPPTGHVVQPPHGISLSNSQPNMHIPPGSALPPPSMPPPSGYMPGAGGPGAPFSAPYSFAPPYAQPPVTFSSASQYPTVSPMHAPTTPAIGQGQTLPAGDQHAVSLPVNQTAASPNAAPQHSGEQSSVTAATKQNDQVVTDWIEHTSATGRRYYYNRRTKQSTWEKPLELMTPIERADASTDWKEFTSPDGRKYYYNKVTKQSKWNIPDELKLARERVEKASIMQSVAESVANSVADDSVKPLVDKSPSSSNIASSEGALSSPVPVVPVAATGNLQAQSASEITAFPAVATTVTNSEEETQTTTKQDAAHPRSNEDAATVLNSATEIMNDPINLSAVDTISSADKVPAENKEIIKKDAVTAGKVNNSLPSEDKVIKQEPSYADKQEAKNAFKALLESANVGSDWTWEQAMRAIINDKRYGALKTLGERKQAFNEFLGQRKKQEAEERRVKLKRAREDFKTMLQECKELNIDHKMDKAATMFEDDERFKAIERERERRDLYESFLQELEEKERAKAQEERKRNVLEYRQFLASCDFIKSSTQWRKVQDRLEADERCLRLDKIDRLEIFQDYLQDLEREEEEQRKIQKEELRKAERKNRDDFRKLMEEDVAAGFITAKTHWRDYHAVVKDLPTYLAVASNTSGSTPKDLFEDVLEELQKQYHDDKSRIKDAVKMKKVALTSIWTLEGFKEAIIEDISSLPISDANLKLVFEELLERAKEKEEKEVKKRKRLADDFANLLHSLKEITASSKWEEFVELFAGSREFSSVGDENVCREIFEEYITELKEQVKDNERRRKDEKAKKEKDRDERDRRKSKHRKEKDRGERDKEYQKKEEESEDDDMPEDQKRWGTTDNNKKHKRRRQDLNDDANEGEKDRSKSSHRHNSDHKRSRRHGSTPESDNESKHNKHKRDHRYGSRRNGEAVEELEDGEFNGDLDARY